MTGITQGSGFRETPTSSQTSSSTGSAATTATTVLKNAVGGIQNQSGQSSLGGNNTALINLIQQLVEQIGKNKGGCQPQPNASIEPTAG
ncbi:MAG: hypothetical protein BWK73_53515 [Thiothrix lacustris]|uniref:Uncharacterized protein n=1 Tax=Thiothrix lacustris TaxID=525917 RepID=A0A1Y1Q771_9GAMM|nr:MAG: hypothetical protein BWK73_53515 [Thiothrix lacustris]